MDEISVSHSISWARERNAWEPMRDERKILRSNNLTPASCLEITVNNFFCNLKMKGNVSNLSHRISSILLLNFKSNSKHISGTFGNEINWLWQMKRNITLQSVILFPRWIKDRILIGVSGMQTCKSSSHEDCENWRDSVIATELIQYFVEQNEWPTILMRVWHLTLHFLALNV